MRKLDRAEKHDSKFGKLRMKKNRFVSRKKGSIVKGGSADSRTPLAYVTGAHLRDLAPGQHRNIAVVASRWRHCVDLRIVKTKREVFTVSIGCVLFCYVQWGSI